MRALRPNAARAGVAASAVALAAGALVSGASGVPPRSELSATAAPTALTIGGELSVTGTFALAGRPVAGATLTLAGEGYPFRGFATIAHATTAADGSFAFAGVRAERNTRLRVAAVGPPAAKSVAIPVLVYPAVALGALALGPGRTRLSVRIRHTVHAGGAAATAWWFTARRGSDVFQLVAVTPTREIAAGLTYASAIVDPPSRRFLYRVCVNAPWEAAMGSPATHGRCPHHAFKSPGHAR
ncbi:MAG: hypothetical protein QOI03_1824 [Solirubrobacteraceae bacterium]|jgi:hypothetical protein|nr:hypothetical protein [Solirubrobacteraceae bacterium]